MVGYSLHDVKLPTSNEYGGGNNVVTWNFSWSTSQKTQINVGVDATHGYLNNFNQFSPALKMQKMMPNSKATQKPGITQAQALLIAKKDLIHIYPNDTGGILATSRSTGRPVRYRR